MSRSLTIVIVNWNSGSQLRECLESIPAAALAMNRVCRLDGVVVVDNASTDDSASNLPRIEGLTVVNNAVNRGFGAACNQGARGASSDFVLFLNPDTRLFPQSLVVPLEQLARSSEIGIASIQLLDDAGQVSFTCWRFPRAQHFLVQALGLHRLVPGWDVWMRDFDHRETRVVDQVIGAFFLIHRELFEELGGFDERFFVYFEEVDLSLRARQKGWKSLFVAEAQAYHKGNGSTDQIKAARLFYSLQSRLKYGAKHFGAAENALLWAVTIGLEPLSRLGLLLGGGKSSEVADLFRGYAMLVRAFVPRHSSVPNQAGARP